LKKLFAMGALALACLAAPATAKIGVGRVVQCEITGDGARFVGPCLFTPYEHGDFSLDRIKGKAFVRGAESFYLSIEEPGVAQASSNNGNSSHFWGHLRRSTVKPACWVDVDYPSNKICAY
jgi:outer membrane scaffolding protein for murein synthesis (MipA/OmpV family)